jgi:hypothetical protein
MVGIVRSADRKHPEAERTLCYTKAIWGRSTMSGSEFTYKVSP